MQPLDVQSNTYIDLIQEKIDRDPKFRVGGHVRVSKYEIKFVKDYTPKQCEEFIVIKI